MIILIAGATHTGKTALAQRLCESYKFPYLSIDHLKMGLIRSGQTSVSVDDDENLTPYLWSIVKEIIKTAIENGQNLIIEGCNIPFDWKKDFDKRYLSEIRYFCLIMSRDYIQNNFSEILSYENTIEKRLISGDCTQEKLIKDNESNFQKCIKYLLNYILIDRKYSINRIKLRMEADTTDFNLTKGNAKEYFFRNQCSLRNIDLSDKGNAAKFRSYNFDKATLDAWANEWLSIQLSVDSSEWDKFDFHSLVNDSGYRTDSENARKMISVYHELVPEIEKEKRIDILLKHEFSEVLDQHFYFGLIYIAARNKMTEDLKPLIDELFDLLEGQPQDIKKEYENNLKALLT